MQSSRRALLGRRHKCAIGPVHPYYADELRFIRRHFLVLRPGSIWPASSTPHPRGLMSRPLYAAALSTSILLSPLTRSLLSQPRHWVRTSSRRFGTGKPLPTPNRRPSSAPAT